MVDMQPQQFVGQTEHWWECFQSAVGFQVEGFGSGYGDARVVEQAVVETVVVVVETAAAAEAVAVVVEAAAVEHPRRIKVRNRSKAEKARVILTCTGGGEGPEGMEGIDGG